MSEPTEMKKPATGWVYAKCADCGNTWKETSRDVDSPSSRECPRGCDHGGDTHVWNRERDSTLLTDASGNLLTHTFVPLVGKPTPCRFCGEGPTWEDSTWEDSPKFPAWDGKLFHYCERFEYLLYGKKPEVLRDWTKNNTNDTPPQKAK